MPAYIALLPAERGDETELLVGDAVRPPAKADHRVALVTGNSTFVMHRGCQYDQ